MTDITAKPTTSGGGGGNKSGKVKNKLPAAIQITGYFALYLIFRVHPASYMVLTLN